MQKGLKFIIRQITNGLFTKDTIMSTVKNLLAGLGGAIALNILHETLKKFSDDTPRIDILGEEALQKGIEYAGGKHIPKNELYAPTLGADLLSNTLYYSMIGAGNSKHVWPKAIALGLAAGSGAIALPEPMGLNPEPVDKNMKVRAMTVGYYLFGALVTACILETTSKKKLKW